MTCPGGASGEQNVGRQRAWEVAAATRQILTSASLRATSIMLPITMSESNVFQASLKYPCTEQAGADDCEQSTKRHTDCVGTHLGPHSTCGGRV